MNHIFFNTGITCANRGFISSFLFFHRGQPKCLQKHGALLQLVRATIMALKSDHSSQMEHLQAIEKVSVV